MLPLLAAALFAAACTGSEGGTTTLTSVAVTTVDPAATVTTTTAAPSTTEAPSSKPVGGGVATAIAEEPQTLNGFLPGGGGLIGNILGNAYGRGVQRVSGVTGEFEADLVEELPTVANGGVVVNDDGTMTVSYRILEEAVWSDGAPVTGDDFQFTLDTIRSDDLPTSKEVYEDIIDTDPGTKTFAYTMSTPTTRFERLFSEIIPKHAIEGTDFAADWNTQRWPSNGPFQLAEWEVGQYLRLERNPNYYKQDRDTGQALPYLDEIIIAIVPEAADRLEAFSQRDLQIVQPQVSVDVITVLQSLEPDGAMVEVVPAPIWEHVNFQFGANNRNADSLNRYRNFRKAVAHAIDRQQVVDELFEGLTPVLDSWVTPYQPSLGTDAWSEYRHDLELAAEYLDAACQDAGRDCAAEPPQLVFSTTSGNPERERLAELVDDSLSDLGIGVEVDNEDPQLFFGESVLAGTWDAGSWPFSGSPGFSAALERLGSWDPDQPCPVGMNCQQWGTEGSYVVNERTERFAMLHDQALNTVDERELGALLQESEQILADDVVILPLYSRPSVAAVWLDEVGGFKHNPTAQGFTWNVEVWYRKTTE
jgi:peptide/nickel transport system substrate-binding protein